MSIRKRVGFVLDKHGPRVAAATAAVLAEARPLPLAVFASTTASEKYVRGLLSRALAGSAPWQKYVPWLADQIAADWDDPNTVPFALDTWEHVRDWMVATRPGPLDQLDYETAVNDSIAWHDAISKKEAARIAPDDLGEVLSAERGWTLQELRPGQLEAEGAAMNHCIGRAGYAQAVRTGRSRILSLRDRENQPWVTFEVDVRGPSIKQAKGRHNGRPGPQVRPRAWRAAKWILGRTPPEDPAAWTARDYSAFGESVWLLPDASMRALALRSKETLAEVAGAMPETHPLRKLAVVLTSWYALPGSDADTLRTRFWDRVFGGLIADPWVGDPPVFVPEILDDAVKVKDGELTVTARWDVGAAMRSVGRDLTGYLTRFGYPEWGGVDSAGHTVPTRADKDVVALLLGRHPDVEFPPGVPELAELLDRVPKTRLKPMKSRDLAQWRGRPAAGDWPSRWVYLEYTLTLPIDLDVTRLAKTLNQRLRETTEALEQARVDVWRERGWT